MFCRVEVLVKREMEVSHYNTVPRPAVRLETAAGSSRLEEKVGEQPTRCYRPLVKKGCYLGQRGSYSFTVTQENTADANCLERREVLLSPQFYRFTV